MTNTKRLLSKIVVLSAVLIALIVVTIVSSKSGSEETEDKSDDVGDIVGYVLDPPVVGTIALLDYNLDEMVSGTGRYLSYTISSEEKKGVRKNEGDFSIYVENERIHIPMLDGMVGFETQGSANKGVYSFTSDKRGFILKPVNLEQWDEMVRAFSNYKTTTEEAENVVAEDKVEEDNEEETMESTYRIEFERHQELVERDEYLVDYYTTLIENNLNNMNEQTDREVLKSIEGEISKLKEELERVIDESSNRSSDLEELVKFKRETEDMKDSIKSGIIREFSLKQENGTLKQEARALVAKDLIIRYENILDNKVVKKKVVD